MALFAQHLNQDLHVLRIADELKDTQDLKQTRDTEELEGFVDHHDRRQDGQQIDDGKSRERIGDERQPFGAIRQTIIGSHPTQQIIENKGCDSYFVKDLEPGVLLPKSEGDDADDYEKQHRPIVDFTVDRIGAYLDDIVNVSAPVFHCFTGFLFQFGRKGTANF